MAFSGKYSVRSKIELNGNIIEQVSNFDYLGYVVSFMDGYDEDGHISFMDE